MKSPRRPEARSQTRNTATNHVRLPYDDGHQHEHKERLRRRKMSEKLGSTAIVSGILASGLVLSGLIVSVGQDRNNFAHPTTIAESLESAYYELGQDIGFLDCATPPTIAESNELLTHTRTIAEQLPAENGVVLNPFESTERYKLANQLGLTLVPQNEAHNTLNQLNNILSNPEQSSQQIIDRTNAIVSEYMMNQFGLEFEFVPPANSELPFNAPAYSSGMWDLLHNMSVLPKEAYDPRVLWKIKVNANKLKDAPEGFATQASYNVSFGTLTIAHDSLGTEQTLVHELWHSYEAYACNDSGSHIDDTLRGINPSNQPYVGDNWYHLKDGDIDRSVFNSAYSRKNAQEDFAMSAEHWVFELDLNQPDATKISPRDRKAIMAGDWANNVAPNLAEYITAVSSRYFV